MPLFSRKHVFSIGVDIGYDAVKLVQLGSIKNGVNISGICGRERPENIKAGSSDWQRWAIESVMEIVSNGQFSGKSVVATIPCDDVFIGHMKMLQLKAGGDDEAAIISEMKQKLPFEAENSLIKYFPTEDDNVVIIASKREKIDRHLAIYEEADLKIKSIGAWPMAMAKTYAVLFGRRESDLTGVVMLLDIDQNHSNIVICRHKELLFARSIPIGSGFLEQSGSEEMIKRLVFELSSCKRHFALMYQNAEPERMILFSSSQSTGKLQQVYKAIASQLAMPAQIGDCLAAVEIPDITQAGQELALNWATALGLSLLEFDDSPEKSSKSCFDTVRKMVNRKPSLTGGKKTD